MLYFLHGDSKKILEKSLTLTESMLAKKPEAAIFKIDLDNWEKNKMEELIKSHSLFSQKYIVLISNLSADKNILEDIVSFLPEIQSSENVFIWFEEEISKKDLQKVESIATKVQFFEPKKNVKKVNLNIFDLASAFGNKDKKEAWILYQKILKEFSAEEIYGVLWWQLKTILLVSKTNSADEAGLKTFPYSSAKRFCKNYSDDELNDLAINLISLYHDSRLKGEDLKLSLEKFLLSI